MKKKWGGVVMIKFAIVDDEQLCIEKTVKYIKRFYQEDETAYRINVYRDGMDFLDDYHANFDIVLMDIEMNYLDGMKTAEKLRQIDSDVILIFMTKMAQYAARGYDVDAIGYMVKPVDYFSFQLKLKKALSILEQKKTVSFVISDKYQKKIISSKVIFYIEVEKHKVLLYTGSGEYESWGSLKEYYEKLKEVNFVQTSRYYLVNLEYVTAVSANTITVNNVEIPLSRSHKKNVSVQLTEYCGGIRHAL